MAQSGFAIPTDVRECEAVALAERRRLRITGRVHGVERPSHEIWAQLQQLINGLFSFEFYESVRNIPIAGALEGSMNPDHPQFLRHNLVVLGTVTTAGDLTRAIWALSGGDSSQPTTTSGPNASDDFPQQAHALNNANTRPEQVRFENVQLRQNL
jgi:hypothetical protein